MSAPLPVTVVTGFLGAGKTTLVNRWLAEVAPGEITVIVNEYGAVGIDAELLAARARSILEIAGGCICCTTQTELVRALGSIARTKPAPQRVLIETSGAASPAGVLRALAAGGEDGAFALDGVITVIDATRVEVLRTHDLAVEQLGYADVVVLSRADVCEASAWTRAHVAIAALNGVAAISASGRDAQPSPTLEQLLLLRGADLGPPTPASAPASHVYESVSLTLEGEVDGELFASFVESELAKLAGRIFRSKGILAVAGVDARMIVQGVADSVEISFGASWATAPRRSRLVVVGFGLDRAALERGFALTASSDRAPA